MPRKRKKLPLSSIRNAFEGHRLDMMIEDARLKRLQNLAKEWGFRLPEQLNRIAMLVNAPPGISFPELEDRVEVWLADRQGSAPAPRQPDNGDAGYHVSTIAGELDVSPATVNKYAKLAKVTTPGRGKRSHRYSAAERRAIIARYAVDGPSTTSRARAAALL
jgi:hypothetical protein